MQFGHIEVNLSQLLPSPDQLHLLLATPLPTTNPDQLFPPTDQLNSPQLRIAFNLANPAPSTHLTTDFFYLLCGLATPSHSTNYLPSPYQLPAPGGRGEENGVFP